MTLPEGSPAARLVFPGFRLGQDDFDEAARLTDLGVGGFCVYGGSVREVAGFTTRLQARAGRPLLFCADYEDGLASHVRGGTHFPSNMALGASGSPALAFEKGRVTGIEARAVGVRWVLAPVVDLANRPANPIVNTRSFGRDPALVARLARAYAEGLAAGGVLSCVKHFPGHGDTESDSHLGLPSVDAGRRLLGRRELAPFKALGDAADAVMIGHLLVPALEPEPGVPAPFSAPVVSGTLRKRIGFKGLVSTDALDMRAIAGRFPEVQAAERALLAGCDILLVPARPGRLVRGLAARLAASRSPGPAAALCGERRTGRASEHGGSLAAAVAAARRRLEAAVEALARRGGLGAPDPGRVGCREHRESAMRVARAGLAWHRAPKGGLPRRVAYVEPDRGFPRQIRGECFVAALRGLGIHVNVGREQAGDECVIVGLFVAPRAYSGRIRYGEEELARAREAVGRARRAVAVSFGSPFALEDMEVRVSTLAAFSRCEASQRAAALALAGRVAVRGTMPV
ncbi:MAG: hypothetical protein HY927_13840 [Elusimicrobia bacterium]|nr:hypothetical protein [Elusimicrobiota bacterium]